MEHGVHCTLSSCNRLSFLPIPCQYCTRTFCEAHHLPDEHSCDAPSRPQAAAGGSSTVVQQQQTRKKCEAKDCKAFSLELLPQAAAKAGAGFTHSAPRCERCQGSFCMTCVTGCRSDAIVF